MATIFSLLDKTPTAAGTGNGKVVWTREPYYNEYMRKEIPAKGEQHKSQGRQ